MNKGIYNFTKGWINQSERTPSNLLFAKKAEYLIYKYLNNVCCVTNLAPSVQPTKKNNELTYAVADYLKGSPKINVLQKVRTLLLNYVQNCCPTLSEDTLYAYIVYGQSNGTAMGTKNAPINYNDIAVNNNVKVSYTDTTFTALTVVPNTLDSQNKDKLGYPHAYASSLYNPALLGANELSTAISRYSYKNVQFISINGSVNGATTNSAAPYYPSQPYLNKGSVWYTNLLNAIVVAKNYATSIGKKFVVPFVVYVQGETEVLFAPTIGETSAIYESAVQSLVNNFNNDIKALIGQTQDIPFAIIQESYDDLSYGIPAIADHDMIIKQAQYQMNDYKSIFTLYPTQQINTNSQYGHYDGFGVFKYSHSIAKNIYYQFYRNQNYVFNVKSITKLSDGLLIQLNVPVAPIQIEQRGDLVTPDLNFYVTDGSGNAIPIDKAEIFGPDSVKLYISAPLTTGYVEYMWYKNYTSGGFGSPDQLARPGTFITDSDPYVDTVGIPLPNYLLSFKLPFA